MLRLLIPLTTLSLAAACGDSLDQDDVDGIPPGDATGSDATGDYEVNTLVLDCDGECAASFDGVIFSACDVGFRDSNDAEVTQIDGVLQIDSDRDFFPSRMEGGLDADGSYQVGGFSTELGGQVAIYALTRGTIGADSFAGDIELRTVGSLDGSSVDCTALIEATGARD